MPIPALSFFHKKRIHRPRSWDGFPYNVRIAQYHQHACTYSYLAEIRMPLSQVEGKEDFHGVGRKEEISSIFGDDAKQKREQKMSEKERIHTLNPRGSLLGSLLGSWVIGVSKQ